MKSRTQSVVDQTFLTPPFSPLPGEDGEEHESTLEILIVHEDMPTGLRAKQALDRLGDEPGMKMHFVVKLWTFKILGDPLIHGQALHDADRAPILFLSLHGHGALPAAVCDLIHHWAANGEDQPKALVVSFDESLRESACANSMLDYLRTQTAAAEVDLFPHFSATPTRALNWVTPAQPARDDAGLALLGTPFSCARVECNP